jgi:dienelactone hydrolase
MWVLVLLASVVVPLLAQVPAQDARLTDIPNTDTHFVMPKYRDLAQWQARKNHLQKQILSAAGLLPLPERAPVRAHLFGRIIRKGYSIEKVLLETLPGYYLGGNLYRPFGKPGKFPGVLSPHGHWPYGRLEHEPLVSVPARCISLARQGYVVFSYDQVGHNDTLQTSHDFNRPVEQLWAFSPLGVQLWNSIRSIDFLQALEDVDPQRIAATGASSGATQTFLLAAVDERVKYSAPVSMISAHMQGGSSCTTVPSLNLGTFNVEIAALMVPRPMLIVSATGDWTRNTPVEEFPAIREIYELYGKSGNIENTHVDAPHNYNRPSREAVYRFFGKHLLGETDWAKQSEGDIRVEPLQDLLALHNRTLPEGALAYDEIFKQWKSASNRQAEVASTDELRERLRYAMATEWPDRLVAKRTGERIVLSRAGRADRIECVWIAGAGERTALVVHPDGEEAGRRTAAVRDLVRQGYAVLLPNVFRTAWGTGARHRAMSRRDFLMYNRSDDANRVQDILTCLKFLETRGAQRIKLTGIEQAGVWCLFAAAVAPIEVTLSADLDGFDGSDEAFLKQFFVPGIQRAGGLAAALRVTRYRPRSTAAVPRR